MYHNKTKAPDEPSTSAVVLIPSNFENLSIRIGPSTDYQIIGSMNHTDKSPCVYLIEDDDLWERLIKEKNKEGIFEFLKIRGTVEKIDER